MEHKGTLTPNVRRIEEDNFDSSTGFAVTGISEVKFQIQAQSGQFNMVNVHDGTCTCKETEIGGTFAGALTPPAVKRPPSRPRKQKILSTGEDKVLKFINNYLYYTIGNT